MVGLIPLNCIRHHYFTVTSIFSAAAHPERIRVAVVDQIVADEDGSCDIPHSPCSQDPNQPICLYKDQIDVYQMDAELAVGPVFARHIGYRLYRGEYYAMQSDAHVTFTKGWDDDIISQIEATGDEMAVLTTYLTDIVGSIDPITGLSLRRTRPIMCNTEYEGTGEGRHLRHLAQPEGMPDIHGMPQLQPYWAAGYSFSRGHFVATVPYDLYQVRHNRSSCTNIITDDSSKWSATDFACTISANDLSGRRNVDWIKRFYCWL